MEQSDTHPPQGPTTAERWRLDVDRRTARKERERARRAEFDTPRTYGLDARHRQKLSRNHDTAETRSEQDREDQCCL